MADDIDLAGLIFVSLTRRPVLHLVPHSSGPLGFCHMSI